MVRSELGCPSGLSELECNQLQAAILELKNSGDPFCRTLGATVEYRFNNNLIAYDPSAPYYGAVFPNLPYVIFLGPSAFDSGELGKTVAHEESHISYMYEDLRNGAWNDAYAVDSRCAGIW